jgi:histidyl-tRNA synthetase
MKKEKTKKQNKQNTEAEFSENLIPALFFGFKITQPVAVTQEEIKLAKSLYKEKNFLHNNLFPIEELIANIKGFKNRDRDSIGPQLLINQGVASGPHNKHSAKTGEEIINLHIIGIENSIAEALAIKTTEAILNSNNYKNVFFKINDLGNKSALNRYNKEGTAYFRKYISALNADDRQLFKQSLYHLISNSKNLEDAVFESAPKTMDFLGDETRKNFVELLEYLEFLETPHEIDGFLLGDQNYSSDTVFKAIDENTYKTVAYGTRYDLLSRKIGIRKDVPALSVMIRIKKRKTVSHKKIEKLKNPNFFLIQVGHLAKIKSLKIIDELRKENIAVKHTIYRDKISSQILFSKKYPHDYDIIIGHRESIENCAIVRDSQGRSQKSIKMDVLAQYLKSLKKQS